MSVLILKQFRKSILQNSLNLSEVGIRAGMVLTLLRLSKTKTATGQQSPDSDSPSKKDIGQSRNRWAETPHLPYSCTPQIWTHPTRLCALLPFQQSDASNSSTRSFCCQGNIVQFTILWGWDLFNFRKQVTKNIANWKLPSNPKLLLPLVFLIPQLASLNLVIINVHG